MPVDAKMLRIAELLASRLCHEMVSPVGAINNGVEILEDDPAFANDAAQLIGQSAREASRRLQFYRIAYGSIAPISDALTRAAALGLFEGGRIECRWPEGLPALDGGHGKLLCNVLLLAMEALPRGGVLEVAVGQGGLPTVTASGEGARPGPGLVEALADELPIDRIDARTVEAAFTAALAGRLGLRVEAQTGVPGQVLFTLAKVA